MSYEKLDPNSSDYACSLYHPNMFYAEQIGGAVVQPVVCGLGIIVFSIITAVFSQKKKFKASTYRFMKAMAIVDLLTMILLVLEGFSICQFNWCRQPFQMYLYIYAAYIVFPLSNITETISCWLTIAIAVERLVTMYDFSLTKTRCSPNNVWIYCASISTCAILLNSPLFFLQTFRFAYDPQINRTVIENNYTAFFTSRHYVVYSWVKPLLVQILPLIILTVCGVLLIIMVGVHRSRMSMMMSRNSTGTASGTALMALENARKSIGSSAGGQRVSSKATLSPSTAITREPQSERFHKISNTSESTRSTTQHASQQQMRHRAQQKLTILIIVTIVLFLVGQIPQAFAYRRVYITLNGELDCFYGLFLTVTRNLSYLCYCATIAVYFCLNRHFRETLCSWVAPLCPALFCCSRARREHWIRVPGAPVGIVAHAPSQAIKVPLAKHEDNGL